MLALLMLHAPQLVLQLSSTSSSPEPVSLAPSLGLLAAALVAVIYLLLTRSTKQAIALPTEDEKSFIVELDSEISPRLFYPGLRRRKLALVGLLVASFGVSLFQAGWDAVSLVGRTSLLQDGIMLVFWVSNPAPSPHLRLP